MQGLSIQGPGSAVDHNPLGSQIQHVHIGSQTDVVGEVPAYVVGVVVDDDVIAIPEPVAGVVIVIRGNGEEKPADSEAIAPAAMKSPNVVRSDPAIEMSVLPRMVKMVMRVRAPGTVSHPAVIFSVHMRSLGMSLLVVKFRVLVALRFMPGGRRTNWRGPMSGDMAIANSVLAARPASWGASMAVFLRQ